MASGEVVFREPLSGGQFIPLPCSRCVGCRQAKSKAWTYRCTRELERHEAASFVTLTYADAPPTLQRSHLVGFLKRFRERVRYDQGRTGLKFFACGEYGDRFGRPHYHALLFGAHHERDRPVVEAAWPHGLVDVQKCTPRAVAYVCGYVAKKMRGKWSERREYVDTETGEVIEHEEPFILMSRRPGIGAHARDQYPKQWRDSVVVGGARGAVPRYLHEAWKRQASPEELQALDAERSARPGRTREELAAARKSLLARLDIQQAKRKANQ